LILGLLSDTHGRRRITAAALRLLQELGAEAFVHCGDVGGPEILDEFAGLRAWVLYGNVDDVGTVRPPGAGDIDLTVGVSGPLRIELDGRALVIFHGHEAEFACWIDALDTKRTLPPTAARCDYILHGHTHRVRDVRVGAVRIINPGALYRAAFHTVATLDLGSDTVEFWQVTDEGRAGGPVRYKPDRR
jgi:putative phosphoesterase